jgi:hypothetical protein
VPTNIFGVSEMSNEKEAIVDGSAATLCSAEPIHEETGEGIQAVLQELEDLAEKLRFKVDHVMTPQTNLHIYFRGKLAAYDAAVKAVRQLQ